jgi:hypothetical protein
MNSWLPHRPDGDCFMATTPWYHSFFALSLCRDPINACLCVQIDEGEEALRAAEIALLTGRLDDPDDSASTGGGANVGAATMADEVQAAGVTSQAASVTAANVASAVTGVFTLLSNSRSASVDRVAADTSPVRITYPTAQPVQAPTQTSPEKKPLAQNLFETLGLFGNRPNSTTSSSSSAAAEPITSPALIPAAVQSVLHVASLSESDGVDTLGSDDPSEVGEEAFDHSHRVR